MTRQKNHIFPAIIIVASLLTLYQIAFHPTDIYSMLSVIIGVTGVILYYKDSTKYDSLFYAWVFMQAPNVHFTNSFGFDTPILSSLPLPANFSLGFELGLQHNNHLSVDLNLVAIGLYFLLKYLNVDKPLGSTVTLSRQRKGTFPQIQFPVTGTIEKIAGRIKMTAIYQVRLDNEISIKDKVYKYVLLEPKDNTLIQLTDKKQVCGLRLCDVPDLRYSDKQDPLIDWVIIATSKTSL